MQSKVQLTKQIKLFGVKSRETTVVAKSLQGSGIWTDPCLDRVLLSDLTLDQQHVIRADQQSNSPSFRGGQVAFYHLQNVC